MISARPLFLDMDPLVVILLVLIGLVFVLLLYVLHLKSTVELRVKRRLAERETEFEERVERERKDALERSRAVLKGKVGEQFAPFVGDFPYNPSDARFIGSPVDYVVFDGYTAVKDGNGRGLKVVLVDVKTGNGRLTRVQRRIRKAVKRGNVEWRTVRL